MSITQDELSDLSNNLKYRLIKAPTATEPGEALLAGLCKEDAAKTSVVAPTRVIIDNDADIKDKSGKYFVNDYSLTQGYEIKGVDDRAFSGNTMLTEVDWSPVTLRSIGEYAFSGCTALTTVKFTRKRVDGSSIGNIASTVQK